MSEIRLDVDLEHPPERVWRALTDERLLPQWLDLPRFDPVSQIEITGRDEPRRLAMLWGNEEVHTRLTWELAATSGGCQLLLRQSCVYGEWDEEFREELRQAYEPILGERLPAVLDWLAFGEVDLAAPPPTDTAVDAPTILTPTVGPPTRSPRRQALVLALGLLLVLAGVGLIFMVRSGSSESGDRPEAAGSPPGVSESPTGGTASPAAVGPGRVDRGDRTTTSAPANRAPAAGSSEGGREEVTTTGPAAAPDLDASYQTVSTRLFGYRGEVTLRNAGQATARTWTVTMTMPDGARVTSATGASFEQEDDTVRFTGSAVPAGQSTTFEFEVTGDARIGERGPTSCQVEDAACSR